MVRNGFCPLTWVDQKGGGAGTQKEKLLYGGSIHSISTGHIVVFHGAGLCEWTSGSPHPMPAATQSFWPSRAPLSCASGVCFGGGGWGLVWGGFGLGGLGGGLVGGVWGAESLSKRGSGRPVAQSAGPCPRTRIWRTSLLTSTITRAEQAHLRPGQPEMSCCKVQISRSERCKVLILTILRDLDNLCVRKLENLAKVSGTPIPSLCLPSFLQAPGADNRPRGKSCLRAAPNPNVQSKESCRSQVPGGHVEIGDPPKIEMFVWWFPFSPSAQTLTRTDKRQDARRKIQHTEHGTETHSRAFMARSTVDTDGKRQRSQAGEGKVGKSSRDWICRACCFCERLLRMMLARLGM